MTVSAQAILAYLQLLLWNHEDWKEVQPQSGTNAKVNAFVRRRVLSLARL